MTAETVPVPLSEITTLRTGAAPHRMIAAYDRAEIVDALRSVWNDGDEWFVLGGGSNIFVGDDSFDGTVIRLLSTGVTEETSPREGYVRLRVQAGNSWDELVRFSVDRGLQGIEAMSGIPGTVGAAPVQNIGAYGQEITQTLVSVDLLDEHSDQVRTVPAADLGLAFRTSVLKQHYGQTAQRRAVIVSAVFELKNVGADPHPVASEQLRRALGVTDDERRSLRDIRDAIVRIRRSKGMVFDPEDSTTHGVGSFFQNMVLPESVARQLPAECPRWPMNDQPPTEDQVIPLDRFDGQVPAPTVSEGIVKISSAWLIEHAGVPKGFHLPRSRAAVSDKHALALINRGGARAEEVAELARFIISRVHAEFGAVLHPEPVVINVDLGS